MRNLLIMGSGRSGTSMVAGTLARAGYFMGNRLYAPREANPKGFFEDPEVNGINERILMDLVPKKPYPMDTRLARQTLGRWFFRTRFGWGQRWLARIPVGAVPQPGPDVLRRIEVLVGNEPYCFKDPRFSYTLPSWRPRVSNAAFICVFRDPESTVRSMMKEASTARYLRSLKISREECLEVWLLSYRHILDHFGKGGDWLFVHYNQLLGGEGLDRIEQLSGAEVDRSFPDPALNRNLARQKPGGEVLGVYCELCELAGYKEA